MFFSLANNRKLANIACYSKRFHGILTSTEKGCHFLES